MKTSKIALYTLKTLAILEGVSCIALFFIAMPLKYFGGYENAVKIPGMAHGVLYQARLTTAGLLQWILSKPL